MFEIGVCYRRGEGVPQDDAKAVEYTLMGRQHYYGLGRDVNYEKAVEVLQSNGFPYPLEEESEL